MTTTTTTTTWTVREVPVPTTLDAPDAWLLLGANRVRTAGSIDVWGNADRADSPQAELAELRDSHAERTVRLVAVADESPTPGSDAGDPAAAVIGEASVGLPLRDNRHSALVEVNVSAAHRRRGIGTALLDAAAAVARADGRTLLMAHTGDRVEPPAGPGALESPTGARRVNLDNPAVAWLRRTGWTLAQVDRRSQLDLPVDPALLRRHADDAAAAAGADYRLHTWGTDVPEQWLEEYAGLLAQMSTDAPLGDVDWRPEVWDGERVRAQERMLHDAGYELLVTAAEHVPTGRLAAFTNFWMPSHTDEYVHQGDTLVVAAHRGHRLGMLVKTANLEALIRQRPSVQRVGTWNAQENRWMLAINVALGFRPAGVSGTWQRPL
ncbi:MAG: GNAT family N-acetyltransferase [Cellulomonas sp.]|nr:GNAT family N-acetyltransferase [Cellulomonas sp.]